VSIPVPPSNVPSPVMDPGEEMVVASDHSDSGTPMDLRSRSRPHSDLAPRPPSEFSQPFTDDECDFIPWQTATTKGATRSGPLPDPPAARDGDVCDPASELVGLSSRAAYNWTVDYLQAHGGYQMVPVSVSQLITG
jgi:hypothetical protein